VGDIIMGVVYTFLTEVTGPWASTPRANFLPKLLLETKL